MPNLKRGDAFADILGSSGLGKRDNAQLIPLSDIMTRGDQPRKHFDPQALTELTESIKEKGLLQPILLRPLNVGYELVAGERRYRAAKSAGLDSIPAVVKTLSDEDVREIALTENLNREDLNPVEETDSILNLLCLKLEMTPEGVTEVLRSIYDQERGRSGNDSVSKQDEATVNALFSRLGRLKPSSFYSHRLPLLKLPGDVLEVLRRGELEYSKARLLGRIKNDDERQAFLKKALEGASREQLRQEIRHQPPPVRTIDVKFDLSTFKRKLTPKRLAALNQKQHERAKKLIKELEELLAS